ncbi:MAG TPA: Hsp70 family protein [Trebonia sp.]|nr:Hsp70 family protein [Trebonia sp.]
MAPAIGIDLGTTYSVVAWVPPDGQPAVIPDEEGHTLTPSVVSFGGPVPVVGYEAKGHQADGGTDVAAFFKSSMGDQSFRPYLGGREWTATGLSGLVLAHLRAQAERALGQPVTQAVITVPEYFTHPQRTATIAAGAEAGLDVLRIISEPTAAALAYGLRPGAGARRFIVYDLGGGTFDVSLVELADDALKVIAATGDHELGGRDWDDRIALELQARFRAETGADLLAVGDVGELRVAVEELKRALTARRGADIRVSDGRQSARYTVTREEFEAMSADLLQRTAQLTEQALADAELTWADVDGVLPVGGSTRMPMVRDWVQRMSGRPPMGGIHADEAVALGAAVQAALLTMPATSAGSPPPRLGGVRRINDVVAHSLGMIAESQDRSRYVNSVLLARNSTIPCDAPRPFQFDVTGPKAELEVYLTQGETDDPAQSTYLGRYLVTGFPKKAKGPAVIDITYSYDENAVVSVAATERATGTRLDVRVDSLPDDVPERFLQPPSTGSQRGPTTVYLAFDLSGSMSGPPLEEAKKAASEFVSQVDLTTTSVGLIEFSDRVHVALKASQNATQIGRAVAGLTIGTTGGGNAGHPFDELYKLLHGREGRRFGIVLADGVWYCQPQAIQQAKRCHKAGIDVISIGFGGADRAFLDQIASSTENAFFTGMNELVATFSTIARELTEGTTGSRGIRSR